MKGVNRVILIGTLGKDPGTKNFGNGSTVAQFSMATSESWNDKNTGERKEITEWHRIVANGKLADICSQYLKKGSKVYIEGSIRTRKWTDQNGQERYATEIRADNMQMLDGKPAPGAAAHYEQRQPQQPQQYGEPRRMNPPNNPSGLDDDHLPF